MLSSSEDYSDASDTDMEMLAAGSVRSKRKICLPERLKESSIELEKPVIDLSKTAVVRCAQTGKKHIIKIRNLSRDDDTEQLTLEDLQEGSSLIMMHRKTPYPVTFVQFKDDVSTHKAKGKVAAKPTANLKKGRDKEDHRMKVLSLAAADKKDLPSEHPGNGEVAAIELPSKRRKTVPETENLGNDEVAIELPSKRPASITVLDNSDKDLLINLAGKIDVMRKEIIKLQSLIGSISPRQGSSSSIKNEGCAESSDAGCRVNGINVMVLPARDAYAFALQLMDMLFTKEELSSSLLMKSKKSTKPPLDKTRVQRLIMLVEKRFNDGWDLKKLVSKANQKCRDSRGIIVIKELPKNSEDLSDEEE